MNSAEPRPYRPKELRTLRATLDERWPLLADDEAFHWLRRYHDGRSPYSRVRVQFVRAQLDAVIALALHLGLRRREIAALSVAGAYYENAQVVVGWRTPACRAVPFTTGARAAAERWVDCRSWLGADERALWLNTYARTTAHEPMPAPTFNRLLLTYVGRGWTLKRLRDTCAAGWVRAGLPVEHLRQLLGLAQVIEDTLPYMRLVGGSLEGRMAELDEHFERLVGPVPSANVAVSAGPEPVRCARIESRGPDSPRRR